jgi:hypothetical protein
MNPVVFIVGCPRSGTTLLHRLADAHPELAIVHETLWIPGFYERRAGLTPDGDVTPALLPRLIEHRRFGQLGIDADELERLLDAMAPVSFARFVSALFDGYGEARGKRLVGDKSPGYVRSIPVLHALWPRAKFVHLIRDGREVWLSVAGWKKGQRSAGRFATWKADPLATTALWWERSVRLGREAGASLDPRLYREVRYDDLVQDPERECHGLCAFLGLDYDDAMLRFHEGRARYEPGLPTKRAWLPPLPGVRDWGAEMPAGDVERFEATAGELLDELGYPRLHRPISARAGERAAAIRSAFIEDARTRGHVLPEHWRS